MKILVTGGLGFIGSNFIINQINKTKNKIINIDNLTYAASKSKLEHLNKSARYSFFKGDIVDKNYLIQLYKKNQPDITINFAAETHVDRSIDSPNRFINTNILGTLNLIQVSLDFYQENKSHKFIHISTDEVFGSLKSNDPPFTEKSNYAPSSPYSASKASSDHLVSAWHKTYGLPSIITNCSNNYGPYQFPEKLIPLIISNCVDKKKLPVYGDGMNIRDWLYVDDHCLAISKIIKNGKIGETYNIGGNNEYTNLDIVTKICSIFDELKPLENNLKYNSLIKFVKDRPGHDFRYAIDSSKIKSDLGWKPTKSFDRSLKDTVVWYLENEKWWRKIQKKEYNQQRLGLKKF
tara:strand:- start:1706 stop:2752 length:1047 start_codon:yes stop_codon:yes gene_type:complete